MSDFDFVSYLKAVDTPTLSNVIEKLRCRPRAEGFTPLTIRSLFPEFGRMWGYAVTAQVETVSCMSSLDAEPFYELFTAIESSPKPSVVVL
jgi:4-hydroxy-4-methyl-2-oxoglutarate aldolase